MEIHSIACVSVVASKPVASEAAISFAAAAGSLAFHRSHAQQSVPRSDGTRRTRFPTQRNSESNAVAPQQTRYSDTQYLLVETIHGGEPHERGAIQHHGHRTDQRNTRQQLLRRGATYAGFFQGTVIAVTVEATSFHTISDRNAKTNFRPIDSKDILDRVSRLPITSWHFKTDLKKRHLGPMARDFHAAFGLDGDDDKHINLTDMAGISLAAIQELSKQLPEKDGRIANLEHEIAEYDHQLADIRAALVDLKSDDQRLAKR
jgi:hypothetical protein